MGALLGETVDDGEDFRPAFERGIPAAEGEAAFLRGGGHVFPVVGFPCHFAGIGDEISGAFAEPSGFAMDDHLLPAAAFVYNEDAAARHGFKADARPVFRGVGGLEDDVAALIKFLLGEGFLIGEGFDPIRGLACFGFAAGVVTEKGSPLGDGGGEVFVDAPRVLAEFVFILPGDVPGPEPALRARCDEGEGGGVEAGAECDELDGGIVIDGSEAGHELLSHVFVLVEEEGDVSPAHGFLLLAEEPCHAVDEDGAARALADFRQGGEKVLIAEADHGRVFGDGIPIVRFVDDVAALQHFIVQSSSPDVFLRGDEVELDAEFFPDGDLVVEFGSRPSVEGREARNIQ